MISVILKDADAPAELATLLAALVPAAAEGLVRDVAVLGAIGPSAEIADDAGATLYAAEAFAEAVAGARGSWLAGLPLRGRLSPDWMGIVAAHVALAPTAALLLQSRRLSLAPRPEGWLVPKALAPSAGAVEQDLQRLARRSGRRLRIFDRA